jgi:hypothetical protein
MGSIDQRLRLAATVRKASASIAVAGEQAHELGLVDLALQLLDAETQLLKLHGELLELGRKSPALRGWPAPPQPSQEVPF